MTHPTKHLCVIPSCSGERLEDSDYCYWHAQEFPEPPPPSRLEALTSKLRTIEPFSSPDGIRAEVEFHKLGGSGCVVVTGDTPGFEQEEVVLSAREAHDLMLWLRCALGLSERSASETSCRYEAAVGSVCNKCGRIHDFGPNRCAECKTPRLCGVERECLRNRYVRPSVQETKPEPIREGEYFTRMWSAGEAMKCAIDKTCLEYPRCRCGSSPKASAPDWVTITVQCAHCGAFASSPESCDHTVGCPTLQVNGSEKPDV